MGLKRFTKQFLILLILLPLNQINAEENSDTISESWLSGQLWLIFFFILQGQGIVEPKNSIVSAVMLI